MTCDSPRVYVLLSPATLRIMRSWQDLFGPAVSPDALSAVLDTFSWPGWGAAFEVACVMDAPLIEFCTLGFVHAVHPADAADEVYYLDSPCHPDVYVGSPVPAADIWAAEAFFRFARRIDED